MFAHYVPPILYTYYKKMACDEYNSETTAKKVQPVLSLEDTKLGMYGTTYMRQSGYNQLGVILLVAIGFGDGLSGTLARERYCSFTLSALSNVFTTYLYHLIFPIAKS